MQLLRIAWEQVKELHTLDTVVVKTVINRGYNGDSSIPEIPPSVQLQLVALKVLW